MRGLAFGTVVLYGFVLTAGFSPAEVSAQDRGAAQEIEKAVKDLKQFLSDYDRRGGGNTIPIERAIIRLKDLRASGELLEFVPHRRFGSTVVWALSEIGEAKCAAAILKSFGEAETRAKLSIALHLAAFHTKEVRAWLTELAEEDGADAPEQQALLSASRLRAGDEAVTKETRAALKSGKPREVAEALLTLGESRSGRVMEWIVKFLDDDRALDFELKSKFGVRMRKQVGQGWSERTEYPVLKTLGEVALEAVNRLVSPTTPGYVTWWYDLDKGPRFGGEEGRDRLRGYLEADKAAKRKKAVNAETALAAVVRHLRRAGNVRNLAKISFKFAGKWEIRLEADGDPRTIRIDGKGNVIE